MRRSNEHFDQHKQGRKYSTRNEHFEQHEQRRIYGTQQFREPLLQCDEHSQQHQGGRERLLVSAAQERLLHCQQHQGQQRATPTESAAQLKAWGEATRWLKGRAENEQVAKLTARGRLLRAQFWVPVRIFQTSPGFFSHCKVELDFFRMKASKSSHFSVLNFVTSGGVFSVLKSVEMCDQFLAWRAQCTSTRFFRSFKVLG